MPAPTAICTFEHGIRTRRSDGATIAERFQAYVTEAPDDVQVLADHYPAGPFPRINLVFGKNQALAEARARTITHWHLTHPNASLVLIGHSNGCDVARRTAIILEELQIPVALMIFVAAPLKPSLDACGLTPVLAAGARISNWVMELDEVLPPKGSFLRGLLSWPYGNAGKYGFDDADGWLRRFEEPPATWRSYNRRFPWRHCEAFSSAWELDTFDQMLTEIRALDGN
jgi:hypothetical protein